MATVLVVDDHPTTREFLTTLLGYRGHTLLEAADGAEALERVRARRPDLVISDILMPTMDGYEFVRRLRSDPEVGLTPVIFYTATYHAREARSLARTCGVDHILTKPAEPQDVLAVVDAALQRAPAPVPVPALEESGSEQARLLTDKLSDREADNLRLTQLLEVSRQLSSEQDPLRLLLAFSPSARKLVGARFAAVGVLGKGNPAREQLFLSGMDEETVAGIPCSRLNEGILARMLAEGRPVRLQEVGSDPVAAGYPPPHLPSRSFLGVPIGRPGQLYGFLCLLEKLGAAEFTEEDELVACTLALQAAVAYENALRFDQIQRQAAQLQQEVAERKQAQEQVEKRVLERTAELRTANQELESFSYSVSHDLRAPLRAIQGYSAILVEEHAAKLDPEARRLLAMIQDRTLKMGQLIDDLLAFSRLGRQEKNLSTIDMAHLAAAVFDNLKQAVPDRDIRFAVTSLPESRGDSAMIRQVLGNLLSNAIKYTKHQQAAQIEVHGGADGEENVYCVKDNGIGFDMKYADKLFGVFQRLHNATEFEGTGVGLAIVHRIISRHGGRVWAEGMPNEGARVYFTLPR